MGHLDALMMETNELKVIFLKFSQDFYLLKYFLKLMKIIFPFFKIIF